MAGPNTPNAPRAVMLSVKEIAERDGVSAPTISDKVKRLVEKHGLTVERDHLGRVRAVNVAEFDHLLGRYSDPSKAQAPKRETPHDSESYDEAIRRKTWHEAERKRIELEQLRGNLIATQDVIYGYERAAAAMTEAIDRVDEFADDFAAAVGKDGVRGAELTLKRLKAALLEDLTDALERHARDLRAGMVQGEPAAA